MTDKNDNILMEARERFHLAKTFEAEARENWKADMRFGYGDNINLYQWEGANVDNRTTAGKPCFTMNRVKPYCLSIINGVMKQRASVTVRPISGGASFEAAEIFEGLLRHIETNSDSEQAYQKAVHDAVFAGIGYFRLVTEYADDGESFDQEVKLIRVPDALSVHLDPHIQTLSGEDAEWGLIFTDTDKKAFEKSYPKAKNLGAVSPLGEANEEHDKDWNTKDRVRIAEYYRRVRVKDIIHVMPDGQVVKESEAEDVEMPDGADESFLDGVRRLSVNSREIEAIEVEWYLIAGNMILETTKWAGKYIPIIRVVGLETCLDGTIDRIGHVRALKDAQTSLNYYVSAGVEYVANQTKSPWMAAVAAIEGQETFWANSNIQNYAVLPFNHLDDDGNKLDAPQRADPPVYAAAFLDGMRVSIEEMELVSAQPPTSMGQESQERSGAAIEKRTINADNATFHFAENFATALRYLGKQLIDIVPKIYDTARTIKILALDGTPKTIQINPNMPQAHQPVPGLDDESLDPMQVAALWNPNIGSFSVIAEIGPQYATKREQFVSACMDILRENPQLAAVIGDLVFRNMDFAGANQIAERLRRMVPPQALGTEDPQITQMQQLLAQQHMVMQNMQHELEKAKLKEANTADQKQIDWFEAETKRADVFSKIDPEAYKVIIREQVSQMVQESIHSLLTAHALEDAQREQLVGLLGQPQAPQAPQAPGTPQ